MMALLTLALCLVVRALRSGGAGWLIGAAVVLGIAFNVKLAESWLALPPLALIAWLGLRADPRLGRRATSLRLLGAGAAYVAVALSWLVITLLVPAHSRPYAVGSTNGSPWNAAFVFNGIDRLRGSQQLEGAAASFDSARRYPQATQAERDRIPITPPSATRLLTRVGPLSGERLGIAVLAAVLLGLPALASTWWARRRLARAPVRGRDDEDLRRLGVRRAILAGLALWLLEGIVLFSAMARLHPRYTEAFVPAVAAMLGVGAAWATARPREEWSGLRRLVLIVSVVAVTVYAERLLYGTPAVWWITLAGALAAIATVMFERTRALALAPLLCCVLAVPLWASLNGVRENVSDGNVLGALPSAELQRLSAYLRAHDGRARYEVAYDAATKIGALVLRDGRPVLPLTTVEGRLLIPSERLAALASAGGVRYAFLSAPCQSPPRATNADCSAPAAWVRAHGIDVSAAADLPSGTLWKL